MNLAELKEYLGIVVDMEESIFLQNSLIGRIKYQIEELKIPKVFVDPAKPIEPTEPKGLPELTARDLASGIIYCGLIGFGLWFISMIVIMAFLELLRAISETHTYPHEWLVLLSFVAPIVKIYNFIVTRKKEASDNMKLLEQHQLQLSEYQLQLSEYQKKIEENCRLRQMDKTKRNTKTIFLQGQQKEAEKGLAESKCCLQKIYAKNIIFPKYRNLVMVCSLYEYICAGRCTELEGHEGAYNILETEIRLDRIISQLDLVVANLEQIKRNQFMLYSAVQESNQRLSQITGAIGDMSASLEGIYSSTSQLNENAAQLNAHIAELQKNSALTAYHAERTQKELAYMNRMDYLAGRNDDVFFNHPPV